MKEEGDETDFRKKFPSIDFDKLENEQLKLFKKLSIKDSIDFSTVERIGACVSAYFNNNIVSAFVLFDQNFEVLEQEYCFDKMRFPYVPGFRAYRELPSMTEAYSKLEERPDVVFIQGHGIAHPRLGLASHFSLFINEIPTIGVSEKLLCGEMKGDDMVFNGKKVGKLLKVKQGSKPLYVSPGNNISIKTAYELSKNYIRLPHKSPEPIYKALKYAKKMRDELRGK